MVIFTSKLLHTSWDSWLWKSIKAWDSCGLEMCTTPQTHTKYSLLALEKHKINVII